MRISIACSPSLQFSLQFLYGFSFLFSIFKNSLNKCMMVHFQNYQNYYCSNMLHNLETKFMLQLFYEKPLWGFFGWLVCVFVVFFFFFSFWQICLFVCLWLGIIITCTWYMYIRFATHYIYNRTISLFYN